jgi:hydrogenase maturation factor
MNLWFGEIITIYSENGLCFGKVRVRGAVKVVSLQLITNAAVGEMVLVCDGVALNRVDSQTQLLDFEQL